MTIFANNSANGINVGQERAGLVGWSGKQHLQASLAHELQSAGGAGSVHFAEGFVEERQADGVGGAWLVETVGLGEGGGHCHIEGCGGFAAAFFGIDLAQQGAVAIGIVDADIVLQVGAIIL